MKPVKLSPEDKQLLAALGYLFYETNSLMRTLPTVGCGKTAFHNWKTYNMLRESATEKENSE